MSMPPPTATPAVVRAFLCFMGSSRDGCWVLGGWNKSLTWGINGTWHWRFLPSVSVLLFCVLLLLSSIDTPLCMFTVQFLFCAPSLLILWDFSLRLSIIFVHRCKRLLSSSLSRTPPSESPCLPSLLSFSFIFLSFSLARSCLFLLFSSLSRWRSWAVTGRRDSGAEDREDDTPPAPPPSRPRTEVPPSEMKKS